MHEPCINEPGMKNEMKKAHDYFGPFCPLSSFILFFFLFASRCRCRNVIAGVRKRGGKTRTLYLPYKGRVGLFRVRYARARRERSGTVGSRYARLPRTRKTGQ